MAATTSRCDGLRIVVAEPGFEQVAKQEQRVRSVDRAREEPVEAAGNGRRGGIEVQVRGEPGGHSLPLACSGAGCGGVGGCAGATPDGSITNARRMRGRSTGTSEPKPATVSVRM